MSRTVAIVVTILSVPFCALPGLGLLVISGLAILGAQVQADAGVQTEAVAWGITILMGCGGLLLLLMPVAVGLLTFRLSRRSEASSPEQWD